MKTYVKFRSDQFIRYENGIEVIYSGRSGKNLAKFLQRELNKRGVLTDKPFAEDWGWILSIQNKNFETWIGCASYEEHPNGFLCFIEPHTPVIRRFFFKKIDTTRFIETLKDALDDSLKSSPEVYDIKWGTCDEFKKLRK